MVFLREWRGHNLEGRLEKLRRCHDFVPITSADDVPILIQTPGYFGFGSNGLPPDYYTNPASMVRYQEDGYERHLSCVDDDLIPYFMPWFGTGVLSSAFGCEVQFPDDPCGEPTIRTNPVRNVADILKLKHPDLCKDGLAPRVLEFIDYAATHSDLPVGLTDMNSPLSTVCQLCGYDKVFIWMYEEPEAVHDIMSLVTEVFINWTMLQKNHIGEPMEASNGLQGLCSVKGGVWVSDDDLVLLNPELYQEFVAPYYSRIFEIFGGHVHFCGKGYHQTENIMNIDGVTAVNNSPMGDFAGFAGMRSKLSGRIVVEIQDLVPAEIERYYSGLFERIDDFSGLIVAPFALDNIAMAQDGGSVKVDWDVMAAANEVVKVIRSIIKTKLQTLT